MVRTLILLAFLLFLPACDQTQAKSGDYTHPLSIVTADGKRHDFTVEVALTPEQMQTGLMYRTEMPENAGMLFWFEGPEEERAFWMKNTFIPLDLIFIQKDGAIYHIHDEAQPEDLTTIRSQGPVAAILEINGGMSRKLDIMGGDIVHAAQFGNALAQ